MDSENIIVNVDGACEPVNPNGIAAYGFVVKEGNSTIHRERAAIGEGRGMTNNVAEYTAAIKALEWIQENCKATTVKLRADSQLLVRQVNGEYAVKSQRIRPLHQKLSSAIKKLKASFTIEWVPREENEAADSLSKQAITEYIKTHEYEWNGHPLIECDACGAWMIAREGKYGKFYGCSRYPKCRNTRRIPQDKKGS